MKDDTAAQIQSYTRVFSLVAPVKGDAHGLVKSLSQSLSPLRIASSLNQGNVLRAEGKTVLVGEWMGEL